MAVQDIRSNLIAQQLGTLTDLPNATTPFAGLIDTANYDLGFMVLFDVTGVDDAATVTIQFEDKEEIADSFVAITDTDQFIGTTVLAVATAASPLTPPIPSVPPTISPTTVENRLQTIGLIGSKRYVQVSLVVTGGGATADVVAYAIQKAEDMPTAEADA